MTEDFASREATEPSTGAGLTVSLWAFKDGQLYKAVCPELSLIVRRETLDAAMDDLTALVNDYVSEAGARGKTGFALLRPVPRSERVRLYATKLLPLVLRRAINELFRRDGGPPRMELRQQSL